MKSFAWPIIDSSVDLGKLLAWYREEVPSFVKILPDQTVRVFVSAAFPTRVWIGKVDF